MAMTVRTLIVRSLARFPGWRSWLALLCVVSALAAGWAPVYSATPAGVETFETPPAWIYGTSAVPPGLSSVTVTSRFIKSNSIIFLSADGTGLPNTAVPLKGLKVRNRFEGGFNVITLGFSNASANGAPFSWVAFNQADTGIFHAGRGVIPAGRNGVNITNAAATANSVIILTVDSTTQNNNFVTPNVRVQKRSNGQFSVTTIDLSRPAFDVPFNYLIANDTACFVACRNAVESGDLSVAVSTTNMNKTAGLFITPDMTGSPNAANSVPDLKVRHRLAGFFRVATINETAASVRVPFNYVIFQPPPRWEELGPTGRSGNTWSCSWTLPISWCNM